MSDNPSSIRLADTVSELMYAAAGWLLIGLGALAFFSGVSGLVQTFGTAEMGVPLLVVGFAFVFISVGIFVNPRFRRQFDRRHEITRFGRNRTVDGRVLSAAENQRESCVSCGSILTEGLVRRYREEFVIAGIPVWTTSENRNFYCPDCAGKQTSIRGGADDLHDVTTERALVETE